jgi:hypothetical protein
MVCWRQLASAKWWSALCLSYRKAGAFVSSRAVGFSETADRRRTLSPRIATNGAGMPGDPASRKPARTHAVFTTTRWSLIARDQAREADSAAALEENLPELLVSDLRLPAPQRRAPA